MSLLENGPNTLTVRPASEHADPDGNPILEWQDGDPEFTVTGAYVAPSATSEYPVTGQRVDRLMRVMFRDLPAGCPSARWARVVVDGATEYDVEADPSRNERSRRTRHWVLQLRERG